MLATSILSKPLSICTQTPPHWLLLAKLKTVEFSPSSVNTRIPSGKLSDSEPRITAYALLQLICSDLIILVPNICTHQHHGIRHTSLFEPTVVLTHVEAKALNVTSNNSLYGRYDSIGALQYNIGRRYVRLPWTTNKLNAPVDCLMRYTILQVHLMQVRHEFLNRDLRLHFLDHHAWVGFIFNR